MKFFPLERYPFLPELAAQLPVFQEEARRIISGFETLKRDYGAFTQRPKGYLEGARASFCFHTYGLPIAHNRSLCPHTSATVTRLVPDLVTSGFYLLGPQSRILPHYGVSADIRRGHMGIFCPPDCALRVEDEVRSWTEGGFLIFDDTYEHEVWNRSDRLRTILLFDFIREDMPADERARFMRNLRRDYMTAIDYAVLLKAGLEVGAEELAEVNPPEIGPPSPTHAPEVIAQHGLYFL